MHDVPEHLVAIFYRENDFGYEVQAGQHVYKEEELEALSECLPEGLNLILVDGE